MEKMLGFMLDCSRNAVMKPSEVKEFAALLKKMGYNTLMLYTEDTYELDGHEFFGHFRGRYSKDELKELDSYCGSIGIELVPCIQTLAHLENMFKWEGVYGEVNDCDNILLCGEEKTYQLIEDMFKTVSECFTTKKIHIGMDEAFRVGSGKYQKIHGIEDKFDIVNRHLHRVCALADKYGFDPMIWSDMFYSLALGTHEYGTCDNPEKILEKAALPENISLVYWDYSNTDPQKYTERLNAHKLFGRKIIFAGAAWSCFRIAPRNQFSLKTAAAAIPACIEFGVDGFLFCNWGDDGSECSVYATLPAIFYEAQLAQGNFDLDDIKAKFKELIGYDFDAFMDLEKPDAPGGNHCCNPSKYLLYSDTFMGITDFRYSDGNASFYKELAKELASYKNGGRYDYLFDSYSALCSALAVKAPLGVKTRTAYQNGDKAAICELASEYGKAVEKIEAFQFKFENLWFTENKPHGFDVQDIRLGGILSRLKSCKRRLEKYVAGEISEIPELSEPMLSREMSSYSWGRIATANAITNRL